MINLLSKTFQNHSYLMEKPIFKDIFKKLNEEEKKELEKIDKFFRECNKHITIEDILYIISKLETNAFVIEHALKDTDNELAFHIRVLNEESQRLIRELFMMLDRKKLIYE